MSDSKQLLFIYGQTDNILRTWQYIAYYSDKKSILTANITGLSAQIVNKRRYCTFCFIIIIIIISINILTWPK